MKIKWIIFILFSIILLMNGCTQNSDTQNNDTQNSGTQNNDTQNSDTQNSSKELIPSIIYARNSEGTSEIFKMRADGSADFKIEGIPENAYGPVVSPDGKKIAFYCHVSDSQWSLYVYDLESSEVKQLTEDENFYDWAVSWTSDSRWLYFTRSQMNSAWESEIWKIYLEDASLTSVIETQAQGGTLSPDGQSLLYFDYAENGGDIWRYDISEKTSVQLTSNVGEEWWPSWSPDGKSIVYQGKRDDNFELFLMELESKQVTQLTTSEGDEEEPRFSPDGKYIVYSYFSKGEYTLYKMNADGTEVTRLTESGVSSINPSWCK